LSLFSSEEIADVLFEDQMLRVTCSPTSAALRDSRVLNWRLLHADAPFGQDNDRSNRDSPNEPRTGVDGSDFLDWPEA